MPQLTKQEQLVLVVVILMLLTGLAVKAYRASHPPAPNDGSLNNLKHATDQF